MIPRTVHLFSVAITTFIPWLISQASLSAASVFPRPLFVLIHWLLVVLLFGVSFAIYYRGHKGVNPFTVTVIAMLCFFAFEIVYLVFLYEGERWFLTWTDWFVPVFLIASTTYWVGKFFR
ncbi:hypothetical protein HY630_01010 [Candidatus Uhrbacteria bacterium]|nr:hypothetical protein [Candidatus Uhrbacteria bacterium]